ncbi:MAG: hypothetical protein M1826_001543 [Phylliscum demangeonii]|nr:MAG: hypothetical protein M1826_001543 [Phylliscum demangeonii]
MGKAGRFACIVTPIALTLASLICILIVGLSGSSKTQNLNSQFYFMKADTSKFSAVPDAVLLSNVDPNNKLLGDAFKTGISTHVHLRDFYTISLLNYCNGTISNDVGRIDDCSPMRSSFWFDPIAVWGLNQATADAVPKNVHNILQTYRQAVRWMFIAYVVAFAATALELVLGCLAIFSRWGSFVTTLVAGASINQVSALFILAASGLATGIYATVVATFNTALKPYNISTSLGRGALSVTWLAVAFSWAAFFFWFVSICCCSGRSNGGRRRDRGSRSEKAPYNYEMVDEPDKSGLAHHRHHNQPPTSATGIPPASPSQFPAPPFSGPPPHQAYGQPNAYEPYRHTAV